jgi:mannose-6-phosphate isomerase
METDHRPWGYYTVLADEPDHKVKRICVYPGKRLSLQRHHRRLEHWYLIRGETVATLEDREIRLLPGDSLDIPCGAAHRLRNTGAQDASFIEVQTGSYFGEDDIERIADDYGRV